MSMKRYVVELGTGIEIHGQDMTRAAVRAVKDAMSRMCIGVGLAELFDLTGHDDVFLDVLIACPFPEQVKIEEVKKALISNTNKVSVVKGGMVARGHKDDLFSDKSEEILVANAAVTVFINTDGVKLQG